MRVMLRWSDDVNDFSVEEVLSISIEKNFYIDTNKYQIGLCLEVADYAGIVKGYTEDVQMVCEHSHIYIPYNGTDLISHNTIRAIFREVLEKGYIDCSDAFSYGYARWDSQVITEDNLNEDDNKSDSNGFGDMLGAAHM